MKLILVSLVLLCGCIPTSPARTGPDSFNAADLDPNCARGCLSSYSQCASGAGGMNRLVANDILLSCQSVTRQCLSTCPPK